MFGGELSFCNDQETPLWLYHIQVIVVTKLVLIVLFFLVICGVCFGVAHCIGVLLGGAGLCCACFGHASFYCACFGGNCWGGPCVCCECFGDAWLGVSPCFVLSLV